MALRGEFSGIFLRQFPTPPCRTFPAYTPDVAFMFFIALFSTTWAITAGSLQQPVKAATLAIAAAGSWIMSSYVRNSTCAGSARDAAYHSSVWWNQEPHSAFPA
eukprot:CAMPEP_0171620952 /NCGR_PEP_ID=MMETSP0990-20121206/16306_1 /TAXON_ID=483369 /ORGANISM="non described non described, Strain CCMP2098" /LENGTH=103 /DNA_ID=CAMNT_0012186361 /DNA_START=335 /DNA_END=642 /DNA_ORIENTATION=+